MPQGVGDEEGAVALPNHHHTQLASSGTRHRAPLRTLEVVVHPLMLRHRMRVEGGAVHPL